MPPPSNIPAGRQISVPPLPPIPPMPPSASQRSPMGHGTVVEQSWSVPVGHLVPSTHSVEPVTPPVPIARVPQQSAPLGQVSAVHDEATPWQALCASHVDIVPPMPAVVQQTSGGLQTAAPHGNVPPSTTTVPPSVGPPPLLLPLPLLLPVPLLLPAVPLLLPVASLPASVLPVVLVVEPPHAHAASNELTARLPRIHFRFMVKASQNPRNS